MLYRWCFRLVNEPPLDIGWIPYVGKAVEFGRDTHGFLLQQKKKFGDVFTVLIAGLKTNLEHVCWPTGVCCTTENQLSANMGGLRSKVSYVLVNGFHTVNHNQHHKHWLAAAASNCLWQIMLTLRSCSSVRHVL